ncbi:putative ankyrin repeat protein [Lachnellula arida]|uniref:Putative ankyrin repeat protein n=1 Tax=Lachnellula arida TaxID=1316785 RepID=A0A8T9B9H4_9HELO|nr:putative ankyrin repeat protein [Lachnellula arida]
MISVKQMKVKPPCFDDQFLFARDETTTFWDEPTRADEILNDDRVLGRYIQLVEIFGKISEWSYAGGRKTETLPPWHSSTQFFKLSQELERFYNSLPLNLKLNKSNLSAHIENRNSTTYASMHTLYSLCLIMLHREYLPFIPLLRARLQGALDNPVFPEHQSHVPGDFWEESAVAIFTAARDIVDIVQICHDNNALPESPQIEFAVSQAAFVCLYAAHFQHMDVGEYVYLRSGQSSVDDNRTEGYMDLTLKILANMIIRLNMAKGHLDMLGKMQNYLSSANTESQQRFHQSWSAVGSLKAYENSEKESGSFHEMYESNSVCARTTLNYIGKEPVNGDAMQGFDAAPISATTSKTTIGESAQAIDHQQSLTQSSILSSFVSPSELNLGINLFYPQHAQNQHLRFATGSQSQHKMESTSIVPSSPLFLLDTAESGWSLDNGYDNFEFEGPLEFTSRQKGIGHFYKSFANLLIPLDQEAENQDQLDANKRLQEQLPTVLENMPERYSGEYQFIMETLLGPPQLSSALCLLEIAVYLFSNNLYRGGNQQRDTILEWTVKTIPFKALGSILQTKLLTLQAFQCALFLYGIKTSSIRFVTDLLDLDVGLQDFIRISDSALEEAIRAGNTEIVKLILGLSGIRYGLSGPSTYWRRALLEEKFSTEIARLLVNAGADVCGEIVLLHRKSFPLDAAIFRGDLELAEYLLSVGADVNPGDRGYLGMAVTTGQTNLLRLLLDHGADVHGVFDSSTPGHLFWPYDVSECPRIVGTALQVAAARGYIEMVKFLLQAGSAINEPAHGECGKTALYAAVDAGFSNIVELLLQMGATVDAPGTCSSEYPRTALLRAVETDNLTILNVLLEFGADPNSRIQLLWSNRANDEIGHHDPVRLRYMKAQLVEAIIRGDVANIYHLLQMGTEIDREPVEYGFWSDEGNGVFKKHSSHQTRATILHWAIASKKIDSELFRHLVVQVKNFDEQNYINTLEPVLHAAVCRGRIDFVEILLDAGVDVDLVSTVKPLDPRYYIGFGVPTALHIAAFQRDFDLVSLLLDRGANINPTLLDTFTPLQLLLNRNFKAVNSWPFFDLFELFISRGADVNAPPPAIEDGGTALQIATGVRGEVDAPAKARMVLRLLTLGANVNDPATEDCGRTALQAASESGSLDIVVILLDHGAEINAPASWKWGGTAIQLASRSGHIKIAQLLLSRGAEVNAPGSQEYVHTALEYASEMGRLDMVQLLINAGADCNLPLKKRYVSALRYAKQGCGSYINLGVVSLLQKYRDRVMEEWNKTRVQEIHPGGNSEDGSDDSGNSSSDYNPESDYGSEPEDVVDAGAED